MSDGASTTAARAMVISLAVLILTTVLSVAGPTSASAAEATHRPLTESSVIGGSRPLVAAKTTCVGPDALCQVAAGTAACISNPAGCPGKVLSAGVAGLGDIPNPFSAVGDMVARAAADAWTAAMLSIWNSGLFVLRIVLTFSEQFLTPDLRGNGPGKDVYAFALWCALSLVVVLAMVQLGAAAFKREGKSLARALIGAGQFVVICAVWFGYCGLVVAACGAITKALMGSLLKVQSWPEWNPMGGFGVESITDAGVATALAFLGVFLWLAAIGHFLVYLARAASLLVLAASGPLSAAGLVSEFTRSWFWKSLRWFHAAAFTPVLMVLVLAVGVQFSSGVAAHLAQDTAKVFGTALPAVMIILISVVAPLALFKLFAFVDPGSPSGAAFRQSMALQGGVQGLLGGRGGSGGSSAASSVDANGRSAGENSAEASTGDRFSQSAQGTLGRLGGVGQAFSAGIGWVNSAGAKAAGLMSDQANQSGVGGHSHGPDLSRLGTRQQGGSSSSNDPAGGSSGGGSPVPPQPPAPPTPPILPGGGAGGPANGSGPGAGGGPSAAGKGPASGGGGAAGGAAAGGAVPPVPV